MKKNILIVGNSAKESALAKVLSEQFNVFVAPGNDGMKEFATRVDIRESNVFELLNFAFENDIELQQINSLNSIHYEKDCINVGRPRFGFNGLRTERRQG